MDPQPVEVTLPRGYASKPKKRWPVTYYLGGFNHDETTFRSYDGEAVTAQFESIVVSPRGGVGYWNDWYNGGSGGPPKYETFVIKQLIPLIDSNFRTIPDRAHRAIMGESGGGYGVLLYATKHPHLFTGVASLSGTPDITGPAGQAVFPVAPTLDGGAPNAIHGPWATQEVRWRGNNPADLAANLAGVDIQMFIGSGIPSAEHNESAVEATGGCALEAGIVRPTSMTMHRKLVALGIAHRWVDLSWGCHSVALFRHEIKLAVPRFARLFNNAPTRPRTFDYRSIASRIEIWNWKVAVDPSRAVEFLQLENAGRHGVVLRGSGRTTVVTPPLYRGRSTALVRIDGKKFRIRVQTGGRLKFVVNLGSANAQQQYRTDVMTPVRKAVVRLE